MGPKIEEMIKLSNDIGSFKKRNTNVEARFGSTPRDGGTILESMNEPRSGSGLIKIPNHANKYIPHEQAKAESRKAKIGARAG